MIYVFGATNVDCLVKIKGKSYMYESNICNKDFKLGGVGANLARSASNYSEVEFVTVLNEFIKSVGCKELTRSKLSITNSIVIENDNKCMYIDVLDENGLVIGASDMSLYDNVDLSFMDKILSQIKDDDLIILDANNRKVVEYVIKNSKGKKFLDAVSSVKLERIIDLLPYIYLIKVNNYEYELIKNIRNDNILITNGSGGKIILDNKNYKFSHKVLDCINPTGCGDTFFGAFVANINKGIKAAIEEAIVSAVACSQINESVPMLNDINKYSKTDLDIKWQ